MSTLRKFTRRLFVISNLVAVFLFLLACANPWLYPQKWWFISILAFIFPFLLLTVILFFLSGLFFRSGRRWALISFVALLIGGPNIHSFFAFHPATHFIAAKPPHSLRVLTWNVRSWDEFITRKGGASGHRIKMMDFIREQQADVVCFQEFFEWHNPYEAVPYLAPNISYLQKQMGYPYYYFSRDYHMYDDMLQAGVIIFSKYPITDTLLLRYKLPEEYKKRETESLIAADIDVNGTRIRVFTTHLQSVLFRRQDFQNIATIKEGGDGTIEASRSLVRKLRYALVRRAEQATAVREQMDKSPYPGFLCGDFNDIPNSWSYFKVKGNWQDAFIKKGFGIGRTYKYISPTLRIDYILADPRLPVLQCQKFTPPYSDHCPIVADLQLP
ncbi:MAG TPA: endonuclease/exonuclease/phosphatase family protein [Puia sp.]|nr:endonuclease/exonuclease/phosphatase family protein [Puia sp.]